MPPGNGIKKISIPEVPEVKIPSIVGPSEIKVPGISAEIFPSESPPPSFLKNSFPSDVQVIGEWKGPNDSMALLGGDPAVKAERYLTDSYGISNEGSMTQNFPHPSSSWNGPVDLKGSPYLVQQVSFIDAVDPQANFGRVTAVTASGDPDVLFVHFLTGPHHQMASLPQNACYRGNFVLQIRKEEAIRLKLIEEKKGAQGFSVLLTNDQSLFHVNQWSSPESFPPPPSFLFPKAEATPFPPQSDAVPSLPAWVFERGDLPDAQKTVMGRDWEKMYPEIGQQRQFVQENFFVGRPFNGLEIPGRAAVYLEGAGQFMEGSGGREVIVWDRSQDSVVDGFLKEVEGDLKRIRRSRGLPELLDPKSQTFEAELHEALSYFIARLRSRFRGRDGEKFDSGRIAESRLNRFVDAKLKAGQRNILVGEVLEKGFPVCRHLSLVTQEFLVDMMPEGYWAMVKMQRGHFTGGAHVWNEMLMKGRDGEWHSRKIEATHEFYSDAVPKPLYEEKYSFLYQPETRKGEVR